MAHIKKTLARLLAVIAIALAMLLCGVLVGCGRGQDAGREIDDGDCASPPPTGFYMKAEIEEKEYYDIDDIFISILYGINIDLFNYVREDAGYGVFTDNTEIQGMYITAYDVSAYWGENTNSPISRIDDNRLYENFKALEVGYTNNGAFLIEEIPHTTDMRASKFNPNEIYQFVEIDNLKDTDYECTISDNPVEIICYKKINTKLPRELFASDNGSIYIDLSVLAYSNDSSTAFVVALEEEPIRFDYTKDGDKAVIFNVALGSKWVVDGTKENDIEAKTKSSSNAKPTEEVNVEYEAESEQDQIKVKSVSQFATYNEVIHKNTLLTRYL